jgi:actin-like ATPase involved in cell morphogenesis
MNMNTMVIHVEYKIITLELIGKQELHVLQGVSIAVHGLVEAFLGYLVQERHLLISRLTACHVMDLLGRNDQLTFNIKGRDTITTRPAMLEISSGEVYQAIKIPFARLFREIVVGIRHNLDFLKKSGVIIDRVCISGEYATLFDIREQISAATGLPIDMLDTSHK